MRSPSLELRNGTAITSRNVGRTILSAARTDRIVRPTLKHESGSNCGTVPKNGERDERRPQREHTQKANWRTRMSPDKPAIATDVPEDNLKNSQGQEEAACFFADF